jgi:hypothetical protein
MFLLDQDPSVLPIRWGDRKADAERLTLNGGAVRYVGIGSGLTGKGAKVVVIDDPYKDRADADSEASRIKVESWYDSVIESRDPDVIVVSEMRDLETIRIALTAAETGHLVLATLHTPDAPQSIDRLVDIFPADQQPQIITQLAGVLEGIISQRLLPRADGEGRVLAAEVLRPSYAIRNCIRERKMEQVVGLMEIGFKEGNRTIDQSLNGLFESGLITREEALFNARERALFADAPKPAPKPKSIWNS